MDKRAARQEYKSKKTPQGIFAVRCKASGEVWAGASNHLDSQVNRIWFELRGGSHRNRSMQAAWNAHGDAAFTYQVLETLDDDVSPLLLRDLLEERRKHWENALMETQTLTAYPVVHDVPALNAFLGRIFGATEKFRAIGSAGGYHTEVQIGDSVLMIGGGGPDVAWKGEARPMAFHIYVPDTDATYQRALDASAESLQAPADQDWGERTAHVKDPAGNCWYIATFKGQNYFSEGAPTIQPFLQPLRSEPLIAFLTGAFGAIETGRAATPDGVILHTTLKIGNSAIELIDACGIYQPMPGMFYLRVADADTVYGRALESGAESLSAPADQPYGDRTGSVKDACGNTWYIAARLAK